MCVCMYICMYALCIYVCMYVYMYVYILVFMYVYLHECMYICIYVSLCVCGCLLAPEGARPFHPETRGPLLPPQSERSDSQIRQCDSLQNKINAWLIEKKEKTRHMYVFMHFTCRYVCISIRKHDIYIKNTIFTYIYIICIYVYVYI